MKNKEKKENQEHDAHVFDDDDDNGDDDDDDNDDDDDDNYYDGYCIDDYDDDNDDVNYDDDDDNDDDDDDHDQNVDDNKPLPYVGGLMSPTLMSILSILSVNPSPLAIVRMMTIIGTIRHISS